MSIISDIQKLLAKEQISEAENLLESNKENLNYDDYHAYRGLCFELRENYDKALKEYYKIQYVGEKISSKFYHFHLAICLNSLGKHKQALANLVEIEHYLTKKDIPLLWQFYVTYLVNNNDKKAHEYIEKICKVSKDPYYHIRYVNSLNNVFKYSDAYNLGKELYKNKKNKQDTFLLRELACSCYNLKNYKECEQYLLKLIELKDITDWDYNYLINICLFRKDYKQALKYLTKIKIKTADTYSKFAYCYLLLDKKERAIFYYEKAITEDPKNFVGIRSYATFYRELEEYDEAIKVLKRYKKENPEYEERILYEMARVESDRENYKKAIVYLKQAEAIEEHPNILCDIAWNYKQLGKYKEEKAYLDMVEPLLKNDNWLYFEMGTCLSRLEQYEEAIEYLKKVNPNGCDIDGDLYWYELGSAYEMIENYDDAYNAFLEIKDRGYYTYGHLAECSYARGNIEDLKFWAKEAKIETENHFDPWFMEVYLNYLTGTEQYQKILDYCEEKKEFLPEELVLEKKAIALSNLSVSSKDKKLSEALNCLKQLEIKNENDVETLIQIAHVYNQMGQFEETKEYLRKAEKKEKSNIKLKREWINYYSLQQNQKQIEKAFQLAELLYEKTEEDKDYLLIILLECKLGHYKKAIYKTTYLKNKNIFLDEVKIIKGYCYYKLGFKRKGKKLLLPFINIEREHFLINELKDEGIFNEK